MCTKCECRCGRVMMWSKMWLLLGLQLARAGDPTVPDDIEARYVGCFQDYENSIFKHEIFVVNNTPAKCVEGCVDHNYAGLENSYLGMKCFCGWFLPNGSLPSDNCNATCGGETIDTCFSVFALDVYVASPFRIPTYASVGCYGDISTHHWIGRNLSSLNTPDMCKKFCAGYKYAGVEASTQCYCGDTLPNTTLQRENCGSICSGDPGVTCGGYLAMDVYNVLPTNGSNSSAERHIGCFQDNFNGVFQHRNFLQPVDEITPQKCIDSCSDFNYAALEQGFRCFCGWELPTQLISPLRCSWTCPGKQQLCGGPDALDVYASSSFHEPPNLLDHSCISSIDPIGPEHCFEYRVADELTWAYMASACIHISCVNCRMTWDYDLLLPSDKRLCDGGIVPYNVNGTNINILYEKVSTINLTSGEVGSVSYYQNDDGFKCGICKRSVFSKNVEDYDKLIPYYSEEFEGYHIIFTSQQHAGDSGYPQEPSELEEEARREVVRVLRVNESNVHVLSSSIDTNQHNVIHVRVIEYSYYQEEETEAKFKGFVVTRWWKAGVCVDDTTTDSSGDVLKWRSVTPEAIRSQTLSITNEIATRKCVINNSYSMQDANWLNVEHFTVSWQSCTEDEADHDMKLFLDYTSGYLDRLDYLALVLFNRTHMNVSCVSLEKTISVVNKGLAFYYTGTFYDVELLLDWVMESKILSLTENLVTKLTSECDDSLLVFGQGKFSTMIVVNLQGQHQRVGVEGIRNYTDMNEIIYQSSNDIGRASEGTEIKVTAKDSLSADNMRMGLTFFTFAKSELDTYSPLWTRNDNDYEYLGFNQYVIQVVFQNDDNTSVYSADYVDVWVNNTSKRPNSHRTVASWDFHSQVWTLLNCDPLRSTRSGLDVFRCSNLDNGNGITRGYFKVFFYTPDFNDYLQRNVIFRYMMISNGALASIGLTSIFLTAMFYEKWCKDTGHKVLLLMVSCLAVNIVLGFTDLAVHVDTSSGLCIALGAIRHFSFLAMFCWMLVMSGLQIKRLTTITGTKDISHLLLKLSAFAWGIPIFPVTVLLSWKTSFYQPTDESGSCYPGGDAFIVTVLTPAGAILVGNFVTYLYVLNHIFEWYKFGNEPRIRRNVEASRDALMRKIGNGILIFVIFGFTWFFHYLSEVKVVHSDFLYEYLFLMTATSHVLFLSGFFVILDRDVYAYWKKTLC